MPTIEYSPAIANTVYTGLVGIGSTNNDTYHQFRLGGTSGFLGLYTGPVTTSFQSDARIDSSNNLCGWYFSASGQSESANLPNQTFDGNNLIWTMTTTYRSARASGTATHFRLLAREAGAPNNGRDIFASTYYTVFGQITGTVGLIGSGADLELGNTSIVAGRRYRIQNLQIQFPRTFTY